MKDIAKFLLDYMTQNNLSIQELAIKLNISEDRLNEIINNGATPDKEEMANIESLEVKKSSVGKKVVKILDLIFRLGAFIMGLVTLLLCIDGNVTENILISLLAVGMVCNSMILLPKIDK